VIWPAAAFCTVALALLIERFSGYPQKLQATIGHPIEWIGKAIDVLDLRFNSNVNVSLSSGRTGFFCLAALIAGVALLVIPISAFLHSLQFGWVVEAILATPFLAQRSMRDHVAAVAGGLARSLGDGRAAVSHIVGRDPQGLDESGVCKAALESLAENTSDGIVAPVFWFVVLGLPGLAVYKAINTADSMIGHKTDRYREFGWAAAKLDDIVNFVPARVTGLIFATAAGLPSPPKGRNALTAMLRDAKGHQSPNAGWPESAMAGALGLRFGGPRAYEGEILELAWMGDGRENLTRDDIADGLRLYDRSLTILLLGLIVLCLLF
jgi:adenosylcobinamide-phosphate synthase